MIYIRAMEELETILKKILGDVSSRFSESELTDSDYNEFLFEQLKSTELLTDEIDSFNAKKTVDYFKGELEWKLSVNKLIGLNQDYFARETTPISKDAKEDIKNYEDLEESTTAYLRKIGKGNIDDAKIDNNWIDKLFNYVSLQSPSLNDARRSQIVGNLIASIFMKVDREESTQIGPYDRKTIRDALFKI